MKNNSEEEKINMGTGEDVEEFVDLGEDGEELSGKDVVKKLREKIKKLESEKAEYLNSWQRVLADYKNREMQIEKDKKEWGAYAVKRYTEDLLVVMDTYDAARSNRAAWESVDANWRAGIEYIFQTFENKIVEQGFEKFGKVGDEFNPEIHEGLGTISISEMSETNGGENDKEDKEKKENKTNAKENVIAELIMSGYKYKGELFRAAKVKVYTK